MKIKRWISLALTAVMAVSVLTACGGGGGSGVSGSISNSGVQAELKATGVDVDLTYDSTMNLAVNDAAAEIAKNGSISTARNKVVNRMEWDALSVLKNAWESLWNGGILTPRTSYGLVHVVKAADLESNQGDGWILGQVGVHRGKAALIAPINTPEKYAATLLLAVDGTVGTLSEKVNSKAHVSYSVAGRKATAPDGTEYWVFAAQIHIA